MPKASRPLCLVLNVNFYYVGFKFLWSEQFQLFVTVHFSNSTSVIKMFAWQLVRFFPFELLFWTQENFSFFQQINKCQCFAWQLVRFLWYGMLTEYITFQEVLIKCNQSLPCNKSCIQEQHSHEKSFWKNQHGGTMLVYFQNTQMSVYFFYTDQI